MNSETARATRAFISYAWESDDHKSWVSNLAAKLRADGVDTTLDQWHLVPGDQLPAFMEKAVRGNDYVLVICTPTYKMKSDARMGGVGYEGDIITAEVHATRNHRKFIPILRAGAWAEAAPSWLLGKVFVDLSDDPFKTAHYEELLATILGARHPAPPVGPPRCYMLEEPFKGEDHRVSMHRLFDGIFGVLSARGWSRSLRDDERSRAICHHAGSDSILVPFLGVPVRADRKVELSKGIFLEVMRDYGRDQGFVRFGPKSTSVSVHVDPPDEDRFVSSWSYRGHNPLLDLAVARNRSDKEIYALVDDHFLSDYALISEPQRSLFAATLPIVFVRSNRADTLVSVSEVS